MCKTCCINWFWNTFDLAEYLHKFLTCNCFVIIKVMGNLVKDISVLYKKLLSFLITFL